MNDNKQISEFNEMALKIQRLHNHWVDIAKFRERGELQKVGWKLDSLKIELIYEAERLDGNDGTKYADKLKEVDDDIAAAKFDGNILKFYKKLMEKEKILREIQQECGMGTQYKGLDEDTMD